MGDRAQVVFVLYSLHCEESQFYVDINLQQL